MASIFLFTPLLSGADLITERERLLIYSVLVFWTVTIVYFPGAQARLNFSWHQPQVQNKWQYRVGACVILLPFLVALSVWSKELCASWSELMINKSLKFRAMVAKAIHSGVLSLKRPWASNMLHGLFFKFRKVGVPEALKLFKLHHFSVPFSAIGTNV